MNGQGRSRWNDNNYQKRKKRLEIASIWGFFQRKVRKRRKLIALEKRPPLLGGGKKNPGAPALYRSKKKGGGRLKASL